MGWYLRFVCRSHLPNALPLLVVILGMFWADIYSIIGVPSIVVYTQESIHYWGLTWPIWCFILAAKNFVTRPWVVSVLVMCWADFCRETWGQNDFDISSTIGSVPGMQWDYIYVLYVDCALPIRYHELSECWACIGLTYILLLAYRLFRCTPDSQLITGDALEAREEQTVKSQY